MEIVDFESLASRQWIDAAGHPSRSARPSAVGYKAPGEAEAEVERRLADEDWLGFAAIME